MRGALVFWTPCLAPGVYRGFKDGPSRSPMQEAPPLSSDDRFFAVLGLLSLAGGCVILLVETQFSQLAGWFGVISAAGRFLFLVYRLIHGR